MARVHAFDAASFRFSFVAQKRPQLSEGPGMQTAARLPAPLPSTSTDVHQVLNSNHGTGLHGLDDTPAERVIAISAETVYLPSQFAEMFLGRASAFRLKRTLQSEVPAVDFRPASFTKESVVGTDSGPVQTQVYADNIAGRLELNLGKADDNVEPKSPLAKDQVGAIEADSLFQNTSRMGIGGERNLPPARDRGEAYNGRTALDGIGASIVPNRHQHGCRAGCLTVLLPAGQGGLDSFRCLDPGRNHQLCGETGMLFPQAVVGCMVQANAVLLGMLPAMGRNRIETCGMLAHGFQKNRKLFLCWVQPKPHRSLSGRGQALSLRRLKAESPSAIK
jgi:hypothetical protein